MTCKIISVLLMTLLVIPMAMAQDEDYRVQYGDTLDAIAREFNASLLCIAEANELVNVNDLEFAQMLTIPADCGPYDDIEAVIISNVEDLTTFGVEETDEPGQGGGAVGGDYRVRYGDTLDVIAQELDVSVACIAGANGLINANDLEYAQVLTIPDDCDPYDSIESIILSNVDDLGATDLLDSGLGRDGGQSAEAEDDTEADQGGGASTEAAVLDETYVVAAGDNLTKIAEAFGVTANCLQRVNNIVNPDLIYTGQELLISGACQAGGGDDGTSSVGVRQCQFDRNAGRTVSGGVYVVQAGDTLDFIACDLGLSTTCLADLNGLDNRGGQIAIGQRLTISSSCAGWDGPPGPGDLEQG
jgi:LysM repeat protein